MIVVIHNYNKVIDILINRVKQVDLTSGSQTSINQTLELLAFTYPDQIICWASESAYPFLNYAAIENHFHHDCIMISQHLDTSDFFNNKLGYIDASIFAKINREVSYPSWLMSGEVGAVKGIALNKAINGISKKVPFIYYINSIAKLSMPCGLFCYNVNNLVHTDDLKLVTSVKSSTYLTYKFIKQHYKWVWVLVFILIDLMRYKKFPFYSLLRVLFKPQLLIAPDFSTIQVQSTFLNNENDTVDVIIPTIGRKDYLIDVLLDLSKQTCLPKHVIIVEQNPKEGSLSELNYLHDRPWPFLIKHHFTHQAGVCNARNIALSLVTSDWVLLGDDDNRFDATLIADFLKSAKKYGMKAVSAVYLQPLEKQFFTLTGQTSIFGAGNSFIHASLLNTVRFDTAFEFGYGEDSDFGMQIRNSGSDVLFDATIKITHLKAPYGGYRTPIVHPWENSVIKPKPSPMISVFNIKHKTPQQLYGYKVLLFLRGFKPVQLVTLRSNLKSYLEKWNSSIQWAHYLMSKND